MHKLLYFIYWDYNGLDFLKIRRQSILNIIEIEVESFSLSYGFWASIFH